MPTICPKCGGLEPGCSVCDAPPRRSPDLIEMVTEERRLAGMGAGYPMTLYWPVPEGTRLPRYSEPIPVGIRPLEVIMG